MLEQALLGLGPSTLETETERMIRVGEMTPFGTTIAVRTPQPTTPHPPVVTDFEKFLQEQDSKAAKKKKLVKKAPSSASKPSDIYRQGTIVSRKNKSVDTMRKSTTESSLGGKRVDQFVENTQRVSGFQKRPGFNFFDDKDRRNYKTESDFSKSSARKRKLFHPKLKHNFSEDRALSDIEVGDEVDEEAYGEDSEYLPPSMPSDEDMFSSGNNVVVVSGPRFMWLAFGVM